MNKTCSECHKKFSKTNKKYSNSQWEETKFCCKGCFYESMRKDKMPMVCEICGKKLNKKVRSDAKYRFCSHKCAGKAWAKLATQVRDFQGEKNPAWRGGITPENHKLRNTIEYDLWRNAVFARDNWTCQKCGIRGHVLHSHHIKPFARFPEFRTSIENGLTVCNSCHRKIHKKYGN